MAKKYQVKQVRDILTKYGIGEEDNEWSSIRDDWDAADAVFVVEVPELPGCIAHGPTKMEALRNAEDAAQFWLATAAEDGGVIPAPKGRLIFA